MPRRGQKLPRGKDRKRVEGWHDAAYMRKEVAEICLACTREDCSASCNGCAEYREAVRRLTANRGQRAGNG